MENEEMLKLLKKEVNKLEESIFIVETQIIKRNQANREILADYKEKIIKLESEMQENT